MEVYLLTNRVNGKQYVGKTVQTAKGRWYQHCSCSKQDKGCPALSAAIRKYGQSSFNCHILWRGIEFSRMTQMEIFFIWLFGSIAPGGYNLTSGGEGVPGLSQESRKKISRANRAAFSRPGAFEKRSSISKALLARPGARERFVALNRAAWDRPGEHARRSAAMSVAARRPEALERQSFRSKAMWTSKPLLKAQMSLLKRGERHPLVKLTEQSVREIRLLAASGLSFPEIAKTYGVTRSAISMIVNRKRWSHVA